MAKRIGPLLEQYFRFFQSKEYALKICESFSDWDQHTKREWSLLYDYLFRGTDADLKMPLWASVSQEEHVLLNQTTLEVIRIYHKWGYAPVEMDGNPPDYIGEQLRFLAYLVSGLCYEQGQKNKEQTEKIAQAADDLVQEYTLGNSKAVWKAASGYQECFQGMKDYLKEIVKWLAQMDWKQIENADLETETFSKICQNSLNQEIPVKEPYIVPTGGINNCGGICVIRPTIQEGCMLNIQSDCSSNDPQIRACVRGRGYRKTFLNSDRLRYPMKRVGERGSGKFERISWEEAVKMITENWIRIRDIYGPSSRFVAHGTGVTGIMRPGVLMQRLLSLDGGYLGFFNNYSAACVNYTTPYIFGTTQCGNSPADMLNTRLLILWGHNPAETIFGPERNYYLSLLKSRGVKIVLIDPRLSQTGVSYADEWFAIKPSTDAALADAMAYVIWSEGLQDQEFMDRCCIGFDEEHMPDHIPAGQSYHAYLFGEQDGIKKTPEWAEDITGIPAERIRKLAREYATTKPACISSGLGAQRHGNGEQGVRGICMLSCLTGNIGIPGGGTGGNDIPAEHKTPGLFINQVKNPYPGQIPVFLWTKAVEQGTSMTPKEDRLKGVEKLYSNIKMIFSLAGNTLINQHSNINDTIRILKDDTKCEFLVCSDIFMTPSARYCDLVLPAASVFETENMVAPWRGGNYLLKNNKVLDPLFECRFEWDWMKELAKNLGLYDAFIQERPEVSDWLKDCYELLREKEAELPDYQTFSKKGGWKYKKPVIGIAFEKEAADPVKHPFPTPSGKIEIFSKRLYEMGEWDQIPAIPKYVPCPEGPGDKKAEKYPLQLIGWHTRRRCHSIHDNNEWQDEVELPGLWIHPKDAEERNIKNGDMTEIWNERGKVRIPAIVTNRIRAGVVAMSQGGWYHPDKTGTDCRGSINVLTSTEYPTPLAKGNPQHTNLVEVRAVPGERKV